MKITPDSIVVNSNIITLSPDQPFSEAMALYGGKVAALGSTKEIMEMAGKDTRILDFDGSTIVPGFNDAHNHLLSLRGKQLLQLDCSPEKVSCIDDVIRIIRNESLKVPAGEWILAGSLDAMKLQEHRYPTRHELDRATTDHPVHLRTQTCHIGVVNTLGFEICGIDASTPDPFGGIFDRDEGGMPNGVCREEAHFLFVCGMGSRGSFVPSYTKEDLVRAAALSCREQNSYGITSCGDALINPEEIEALWETRRNRDLTVRTNMIVLDVNIDELSRLKIPSGFGDSMLRIGGIKSFVDGATAGHTAWVSEPYQGELFAGRPDYRGIQTKTFEQIDELVRKAHCSGLQMEIHANGDEAISMVLDSYQRNQESFPRPDPRHRIAHCTVVNPRLVQRIADLGVIPVPFTSYVYEHGEKLAPYGERINYMFAHRSFLDAGIVVAAGSDNPCASADPFAGLYSMVNRKSSDGTVHGPEQRISIEDALRVYTTGGAYATFEEDVKGTLVPGMLGDFVVLSDNPLTMDPEDLKDLKALATYLGGRKVFSR